MARGVSEKPLVESERLAPDSLSIVDTDLESNRVDGGTSQPECPFRRFSGGERFKEQVGGRKLQGDDRTVPDLVVCPDQLVLQRRLSAQMRFEIGHRRAQHHLECQSPPVSMNFPESCPGADAPLRHRRVGYPEGRAPEADDRSPYSRNEQQTDNDIDGNGDGTESWLFPRPARTEKLFVGQLLKSGSVSGLVGFPGFSRILLLFGSGHGTPVVT